MNLPPFDYKKILLAVLLLIITVVMISAVVWLIFIRQPGGSVAPQPGENEAAGGRLPGAGNEFNPNIIGPSGRLLAGENESGAAAGEGGAETEQEIDEIAAGGLTKTNSLIEDSAVAVEFRGNSFNYLNRADNKVYELSLDGAEKYLLSNEAFPNVDRVTWSDDGQKVILEYPDGANIIYDFIQNKKTTLQNGLENPDFDSHSENVAYKFVGANQDDNWLVVTDLKTNSAKALEPLGGKGAQVQVSWSPDNQVVAFYREARGINSEEIILIGQNDENFLSIKVDGSNFRGSWSPKGDKLLYSVVDAQSDYQPVLWVVDAQGESVGRNNFSLRLNTWVDKCVFAPDGRYVYCAVPSSLPIGAGLYPDLLNDSADAMYKIDLDTGYGQMLAYPVAGDGSFSDYQAAKLFISASADKLYFFDNFSQRIYYIRLR